MIELGSLWPATESLQETLGTDAHTLDASVFLAVHQPMQFRRVDFGQSVANAPIVGEADLLEALLEETGEGRVIVPIAGSSGSGKSHVIRWIEAEVRSRDDAESRHVVLVPKSSSLKSVLRLILRGLSGAAYDEIRTTLERASDSLPAVAAMDLKTRLIVALKEDAQNAAERLRTRTSQDPSADERSKWGGNLPDLLDDPGLWQAHFYGDDQKPNGVIARLAAHVTTEGARDIQHEFQADDFRDLHQVVEVGNLGIGARRLIARLVDEKHRIATAEILNGVLDRATQSLLDLGGTPLSEVFLNLRRALLGDGKELVILIEDFAVMSGMQGALLDALIFEARVGGRQEYCPIRSAIAYTSGYQPMDRDTVRTRARAEWVIENVPGTDKAILERSVELVGAYWNAARWGIDSLKAGHAHAGEVKSYEIADPSDEVGETVDSFGRSQAGYPLFPLNTCAIEQIVWDKCIINGQLWFNPRLIIDHAVIEVAKLRRYFEQDAFPASELGTIKLTAPDVAQVINQQPVDLRERLLTLVAYWAGLPDSLSDAACIPDSVYKAFGLPALDFGVPPPIDIPDEVTPGPSLGATDQFTLTWKPILDEWQSDGPLATAHARELRNWIRDAVLNSIPPDWPGSRSCIERTTLAMNHTFLPNARGAEGLIADQAALCLCDDTVWSDPLRAAPVRLALESVIRFHGIDETKGTWAYPGGELQAVRYSNFVAERRQGLRLWLDAQREERQRLAGFTVAQLVEARLMTAAILGLGVTGGNQLESAIDVLFADLPETQVVHRNDHWTSLIAAARDQAKQSREDLIERISARQGAGAKLLALDTAQLEEPVKSFLRTWQVTGGLWDVRSFRMTFERGTRERRKTIQAWYTETGDRLGDAATRENTITELRALATEARKLTLCGDEDIQELRNCLTALRESPVAEALEQAERALREPMDGIALPALIYDFERVSQTTRRLIGCLSRVFDSIELNVAAMLESGGLGVVRRLQEQVTQELQDLECMTVQFEELGES
jgi:hypothetical protein